MNMSQQNRLIGTGPMSDGLIRLDNPTYDASNEYAFQFSLCLMIIGFPILFTGFFYLSDFQFIGLTLIAVGGFSSLSGIIVCVILATLTFLEKSEKKSSTNTIESNIIPNELSVNNLIKTEDNSQNGWPHFEQAQSYRLSNSKSNPQNDIEMSIAPSTSLWNNNSQNNSHDKKKHAFNNFSSKKFFSRSSKSTSKTELTKDDDLDEDEEVDYFNSKLTLNKCS